MEKARLRESGPEIDGSTDAPSLNYPSAPDIIDVKEEGWAPIVFRWVKGILLFALFSVLLFGVVYVALASTVIFVAKVGEQTSVVARGTFVGGLPEKNDTIYISTTTPNKNDLVTNFNTGIQGADQEAVVKVRSTGFDKIAVDEEGAVTVNGKEAEGLWADAASSTPIEPIEQQLNEEYLVECVSGSCDPGTLFVIDKNLIYGEVKDTL